MLRMALIQAGLVKNVIEVDVMPPDKFGFEFAVESEIAQIGDSFVDGEIIPQEPPENSIPGEPGEPSPPSTVIEVTAFQAKAALAQAGLLSMVEAYMALPDTEVMTRLRWQQAQTFKRDHPTILLIASVLGISNAQLDHLFETAKSIIL